MPTCGMEGKVTLYAVIFDELLLLDDGQEQHRADVAVESLLELIAHSLLFGSQGYFVIEPPGQPRMLEGSLSIIPFSLTYLT